MNPNDLSIVNPKITNRMVNLCSDISRDLPIGRLAINTQRRDATIRKSVSASLNLQMVQGESTQNHRFFKNKDIESKLFQAYSILDEWDPRTYADFLHAAHLVLDQPYEAYFQTFNPKLIYWDNLFRWAKKNEPDPMLFAPILCYSIIETAPFSSGNDLLARLWQTAYWTNWEPYLIYFSVEQAIWENRSDYLTQIAKCRANNDSTNFIEFTLELLLGVLKTNLE